MTQHVWFAISKREVELRWWQSWFWESWHHLLCIYMFFFISNRNFENRLGHAYRKSLLRLKVCFHYTYSWKFCLVYAYEKDLIRLEMIILDYIRKIITQNVLLLWHRLQYNRVPCLKWQPFILLHFWRIRKEMFCNT